MIHLGLKSVQNNPKIRLILEIRLEENLGNKVFGMYQCISVTNFGFTPNNRTIIRPKKKKRTLKFAEIKGLRREKL